MRCRERRAERLREDALRAMIGEKRAQDEKAQLAEQLRKQAEQNASAREELTVEAVGLQRELERFFINEKTLRSELADANAELLSREKFVTGFDAQTRLLSAQLEEKGHELAQANALLESLRRELSESQKVASELRGVPMLRAEGGGLIAPQDAVLRELRPSRGEETPFKSAQSDETSSREDADNKEMMKGAAEAAAAHPAAVHAEQERQHAPRERVSPQLVSDEWLAQATGGKRFVAADHVAQLGVEVSIQPRPLPGTLL